MTNTPSIAQLQSDWFKFSDLERAGAVLAINQTGISTRKIAAHLHFSESLLRHLLMTLRAPASDQHLAQQGKITTNELVRRAKASLGTAEHHKTLTIDREIRIAADLICDWLLHIQLFEPARKMIVEEVRRKFRIMKEAGLHPSAVAPPARPVARIIDITRPAPDDRIHIVAWFARWLCRWSFFAFPDVEIRDNALQLAREMLRGSRLAPELGAECLAI